MDIVKLMEYYTTAKGHCDGEDVKPILTLHYRDLLVIIVVSEQ
jgi:hypothetical protein